MEGGAGDVTMLRPGADATGPDDAEVTQLVGVVHPRPEKNHLFFPPRGPPRPSLRQVLSEPTLRAEFLQTHTAYPTAEHLRQQRRRPDPREDASQIQDSGLRSLMAQLDSQKGRSDGSLSRSQPHTFMDRMPQNKSHIIEHREGLHDMLDKITVQCAEKKREAKRRAETLKFEERMKLEHANALTGDGELAQRPAFCTQTDPAGYFEQPKIEKDVAHTTCKIEGLQGIYDVKDERFRPPHFDFNVKGGWNPHQTNLREQVLDALGTGPRQEGGVYSTKTDGKPDELKKVDHKIKELEARKLTVQNFTASQSKKSTSNPILQKHMKTLANIDVELAALEVRQQELVEVWQKSTIRPGLSQDEHVKERKAALKGDVQPPGSVGQPSRMGPTELHFALRLDRKAVQADKEEAQASILRTMGTHRRKTMLENADPHSALKGEHAAWSVPLTSNHTYFSTPEAYLPGEQAYSTGLDKYVTQPERTMSYERDFVAGEAQRTSFWKGPKAGAVTGAANMHAHAQALLCPPGCKKILSWGTKSNPEIDLSATPGQLKKSTPGFLKKGTRGTPCRFASLAPKTQGSWAPVPQLGN